MVQVCNYDPVRDLQDVEQNGWVDLAKANALGSVPSDLDASDLQFNEIDDPNSILGRPRDSFESAQMAKSIADYVPPKKEE